MFMYRAVEEKCLKDGYFAIVKDVSFLPYCPIYNI